MTTKEAVPLLENAVADENGSREFVEAIRTVLAALKDSLAGKSPCVDDDGTPFASARMWRAEYGKVRAALDEQTRRADAAQADAAALREALEGSCDSLHEPICYRRDNIGTPIMRDGEFIYDCKCWLAKRDAVFAVMALRDALRELTQAVNSVPMSRHAAVAHAHAVTLLNELDNAAP